MFDRFTERARKVMSNSRREAQRLKLDYIGTEHILLGLCELNEGIAAHALTSMGVDLTRLKESVGRRLQIGNVDQPPEKMPFTIRSKKVLEYAIDEARKLNHNYVGTEHLLLGMLQEAEGIAAQELNGCSVTYEKAHQEVISTLGLGDKRP